MADQRITYEQGLDTGARLDEEAIQPFNDGEVIRQTVLRRPVENLRDRTEIVRDALETLKYLADTDIKWIISGTAANLHPQVTNWNPTTGVVTFTNDLCIQPLGSIDSDRLTSFDWLFSDTDPTSCTLTFSNQLSADKGGDTLEVRLVYSTDSNVLTVETIGDPLNIIVVTVSADGTKTAGDLITALMAVPGVAGAAGPGIIWVLTSVGDTTTAITSVGIGVVPHVGTYDTLDTANREMHVLPAATWNAWNTVVAGHVISDGDTVGIAYPYIINPVSFFDPVSSEHGGRRQRYGADTGVVGSDLFISSDLTLFNQPTAATVHGGPALLPLCIPLCKRIGNDLLFLDGTFVRDPAALPGGVVAPIYFGEDAFTISRLTGAGISLTMYVGSGASSVPFSLVAGTLQTNLQSLVDSLNSKGSLNAAETATYPWTFNVTAAVGTYVDAVIGYGKGASKYRFATPLNSYAAIVGIGQTGNFTGTNVASGIGILGVGGDNGTAVMSPGPHAGSGGFFRGGNQTNSPTAFAFGGDGIVAIGGSCANVTGYNWGGAGVVAQGGPNGPCNWFDPSYPYDPPYGGAGILAYGSEAVSGADLCPGIGGVFLGGSTWPTDDTHYGATGILTTGGHSHGILAAGMGIIARGGAGITTGQGGHGIFAIPGASTAGLGGAGVYAQGLGGTGSYAIIADPLAYTVKAPFQLKTSTIQPTSLDDGAMWINEGAINDELFYYKTQARRIESIKVVAQETMIPIFTVGLGPSATLDWTSHIAAGGSMASYMWSVVALANMSIPMNGVIPNKVRINSITLHIKPGIGRTGADRLQFQYFITTHYGNTTLVTSDYSDITDNPQDIVLSCSNVVDFDTEMHMLVVTGGVNSDTKQDKVFSIVVNYGTI